jgi:hypothetical protein
LADTSNNDRFISRDQAILSNVAFLVQCAPHKIMMAKRDCIRVTRNLARYHTQDQIITCEWREN